MRTRYTLAAVIAALLIPCSQEADGQGFRKKWLNVGSLGHEYSEVGGKPEGERDGLDWPHWYDYTGNHRNDGVWIAAKNVTDENGKSWPVRIAHVGPRSSGQGEIFPKEFVMTSRRTPTEVNVDNFQSFQYVVSNDKVDSDLLPDRMIYSRSNSIVGIAMEQRIFQFSQQYHDNYHVIEFTFTNTGNVDADDEIELPDQALEGVYFWMPHRFHVNEQAAGIARTQGARSANWGHNTMVDAVGDGHEDYEVDFRAQYAWGGNHPDFRGWNNLGAPALTDNHSWIPEGDTLGRLTAAHMVGRAYVHADQRAHAPGETVADDPGQPSTMNYYDTNDALSGSNSAYDVGMMQEEYDRLITAGRAYPHHADIVVPPAGPWDPQRMAKQTAHPALGTTGGGWGFTEAFGPYTMAPGEEIKIVVVDAVAGLSEKAAREIGRGYKRAYLDREEDRPIEYDADGDGVIGPEETMSKNLWVMTARDSLFQTFERAIANYESGWSIPQGPAPPRTFDVSSGTDRISLEWTTYDGAQPNGWELYRAAEKQTNEYELVVELDGSARSFDDTEVVRGISYYYYLLAVGDVNTTTTGDTPTGTALKSNRAYTQTYDPATLNRGPGDQIEAVRVVPNPYHLGSDPNVRWPDVQDRIGFLEIPGECTIKIFTEIGELVETIEHTDGSGDAYWNLTTSSNQVVASGVYLAVIEDSQRGDRVMRTIIIIR